MEPVASSEEAWRTMVLLPVKRGWHALTVSEGQGNKVAEVVESLETKRIDMKKILDTSNEMGRIEKMKRITKSKLAAIWAWIIEKLYNSKKLKKSSSESNQKPGKVVSTTTAADKNAQATTTSTTESQKGEEVTKGKESNANPPKTTLSYSKSSNAQGHQSTVISPEETKVKTVTSNTQRTVNAENNRFNVNHPVTEGGHANDKPQQGASTMKKPTSLLHSSRAMWKLIKNVYTDARNRLSKKPQPGAEEEKLAGEGGTTVVHPKGDPDSVAEENVDGLSTAGGGPENVVLGKDNDLSAGKRLINGAKSSKEVLLSAAKRVGNVVEKISKFFVNSAKKVTTSKTEKDPEQLKLPINGQAINTDINKAGELDARSIHTANGEHLNTETSTTNREGRSEITTPVVTDTKLSPVNIGEARTPPDHKPLASHEE